MTDIVNDLRDDRYIGQEGLRRRAADEIERLRAEFKAILKLDGRNDLPDAWEIAERALNIQQRGEP